MVTQYSKYNNQIYKGTQNCYERELLPYPRDISMKLFTNKKNYSHQLCSFLYTRFYTHTPLSRTDFIYLLFITTL